MAKRSGSEKRQRTQVLTMRFKPEEATAIRGLASKRGVSIAELVRTNVLRMRARPSRVDLQALAQLRTALGSFTGAVNKYGSLVNQFTRERNRGREPQLDAFAAQWDEFKAMFDRDMAELRIVCLQALGKETRQSGAAQVED